MDIQARNQETAARRSLGEPPQGRSYHKFRERNEQIIERYAAGEIMRDIARDYGVSVMRVSQIIKESGLELGRAYRSGGAWITGWRGRAELHPERNKEIVNRYQAGLTTKELAGRFGLHQSSVFKILKRVGVNLRRPVGQPEVTRKRNAEICIRYEAGEDMERLIQDYGLSKNTIYCITSRERIKAR